MCKAKGKRQLMSDIAFIVWLNFYNERRKIRQNLDESTNNSDKQNIKSITNGVKSAIKLFHDCCGICFAMLYYFP
jgi:hypothetical protein